MPVLGAGPVTSECWQGDVSEATAGAGPGPSLELADGLFPGLLASPPFSAHLCAHTSTTFLVCPLPHFRVPTSAVCPHCHEAGPQSFPPDRQPLPSPSLVPAGSKGLPAAGPRGGGIRWDPVLSAVSDTVPSRPICAVAGVRMPVLSKAGSHSLGWRDHVEPPTHVDTGLFPSRSCCGRRRCQGGRADAPPAPAPSPSGLPAGRVIGSHSVRNGDLQFVLNPRF